MSRLPPILSDAPPDAARSPPLPRESLLAGGGARGPSAKAEAALAPTGNSQAAHSSLGQASIGQASLGQASIGQASLGQASIGQASLGQASIGQASLGQASIEELIRSRVAILLERLENGPIADLYSLVVREVERGLLSLVLERCGGNRGQAALQLGLHRNTLRQKLIRLGIDPGPDEPAPKRGQVRRPPARSSPSSPGRPKTQAR